MVSRCWAIRVLALGSETMIQSITFALSLFSVSLLSLFTWPAQCATSLPPFLMSFDMYSNFPLLFCEHTHVQARAHTHTHTGCPLVTVLLLLLKLLFLGLMIPASILTLCEDETHEDLTHQSSMPLSALWIIWLIVSVYVQGSLVLHLFLGVGLSPIASSFKLCWSHVPRMSHSFE